MDNELPSFQPQSPGRLQSLRLRQMLSFVFCPHTNCLTVLLACLIYPLLRKGGVTANTLIKLFAQSFIQSILELVVISCIYTGCSTSILIGPLPPRSVNKRTSSRMLSEILTRHVRKASGLAGKWRVSKYTDIFIGSSQDDVYSTIDSGN